MATWYQVSFHYLDIREIEVERETPMSLFLVERQEGGKQVRISKGTGMFFRARRDAVLCLAERCRERQRFHIAEAREYQKLARGFEEELEQ